MRTSATGIRRATSAGGFTLLELLIVMAVAGLLISLVVVSVGSWGGRRPEAQLRELADRIALVHEESALSGRTLGIKSVATGIEFVVLTLDPVARRADWRPASNDRLLVPATFPSPLVLSLEVDGSTTAAAADTPTVILLPDGDQTPFRISLAAPGERGARLLGAADGSMQIETDP